ncbi:MAG: elongation factor Ts [Lachnospiraceae bacterium]|jgi:elongation factor Ts|nr:elongation factor Ts [Lachnospiraceae bacterium]
MVTAAQVKELREKTGAGMMECKKVLAETDGNEEKAIELLKERGVLKAEKKSGRVAAEGLVNTYISDDKKVGAIVEVNCETDFVSRGDDFKAFVASIAKQVATQDPKDVEDLLAQKYIEDESITVQEALTNLIAKIGENMSIRRFNRYETEGALTGYLHNEGAIGVLVDLSADDEELGQDICLQITAGKPEFLNEDDVPADRLEKEKEILKAQVINEGRPENVAEKIVMGRLGKFYGEYCLVDQEFVKDSSQLVKDVLKSKGVTINRFARLERGEGIEKKQENFAEEIAKQVKGV